MRQRSGVVGLRGQIGRVWNIHGVGKAPARDQPVVREKRGIVVTGQAVLLHQRVEGGVDFAQDIKVLLVVLGGRCVVGPTVGRNGRVEARGPHDDGPVEPHLHLECHLRSAEVGVSPGVGRHEGVGDRRRPIRGGLPREDARHASGGRDVLLAGEKHGYVGSGRRGRTGNGDGVLQCDGHRVALVHDERGTRELHGDGPLVGVSPGVDGIAVGCGNVPLHGREVKGGRGARARHAENRGVAGQSHRQAEHREGAHRHLRQSSAGSPHRILLRRVGSGPSPRERRQWGAHGVTTNSVIMPP